MKKIVKLDSKEVVMGEEKKFLCESCVHYDEGKSVSLQAGEKPEKGFGTMGKCKAPNPREGTGEIWVRVWGCDEYKELRKL